MDVRKRIGSLMASEVAQEKSRGEYHGTLDEKDSGVAECLEQEPSQKLGKLNSKLNDCEVGRAVLKVGRSHGHESGEDKRSGEALA